MKRSDIHIDSGADHRAAYRSAVEDAAAEQDATTAEVLRGSTELEHKYRDEMAYLIDAIARHYSTDNRVMGRSEKMLRDPYNTTDPRHGTVQTRRPVYRWIEDDGGEKLVVFDSYPIPIATDETIKTKKVTTSPERETTAYMILSSARNPKTGELVKVEARAFVRAEPGDVQKDSVSFDRSKPMDDNIEAILGNLYWKKLTTSGTLNNRVPDADQANPLSQLPIADTWQLAAETTVLRGLIGRNTHERRLASDERPTDAMEIVSIKDYAYRQDPVTGKDSIDPRSGGKIPTGRAKSVVCEVVTDEAWHNDPPFGESANEVRKARAHIDRQTDEIEGTVLEVLGDPNTGVIGALEKYDPDGYDRVWLAILLESGLSSLEITQASY